MSCFRSLPPLIVGTHRSGPTAWDMRVFLCRGLSSTRKQCALYLINDIAKILDYRPTRLPLVLALREAVDDRFDTTRSHRTVITNFGALKQFFVYCDNHDLDPTTSNVAEAFRNWVEHERKPDGHKEANEISVYSRINRAASLLADACGLDRLLLTLPARLEKPKRSKIALGTEADKQHIQRAFSFGICVASIIECLSHSAILGQLPIPLTLGTSRISLFSGYVRDSIIERQQLQSLCKPRTGETDAKRAALFARGTLKQRYSLVNLRMEAELLLFISQTGLPRKM
jgi:hypothetical protein